MTIADLLDSGMRLQGCVCIQTWTQKDECLILLDTNDFEYESLDAITMYSEISYMFANDNKMFIEIVM